MCTVLLYWLRLSVNNSVIGWKWQYFIVIVSCCICLREYFKNELLAQTSALTDKSHMEQEEKHLAQCLSENERWNRESAKFRWGHQCDLCHCQHNVQSDLYYHLLLVLLNTLAWHWYLKLVLEYDALVLILGCNV